MVGRVSRWWLGAFLLFVCALIATIPWLVDAVDDARVAPRQLSRYVVRRSLGHNPSIVAFGAWLGETLMRLDRGIARPTEQRQFRVGAQPQADAVNRSTQTSLNERTVVIVKSSVEASAAIGRASPGDVITFLPGVYRFTGGYIGVNRPGTQRQRIVVRADQPGTVILEMAMVEGFLINVPYWSFENLTINGACDDHSTCEHAFHIVGAATNFISRNNTISDFNAHFKINAMQDVAPDDGLIENTTLTNRGIRRTSNPVTPIDLVVASGWTFRKNLITDFIKGEGNLISYGAFAKGGGTNNVFENNIILCEYLLRAPGMQAVGLSFGGGGTGAEFCRDRRCITEQENGVIRGNLIASCSDDGIYLNRAAATKILHNTLIDTAGIAVRFPTTSADVEGNLVDGQIRVRNGALLRATDNIDTSTLRLFTGSHPLRQYLEIYDASARRPPPPRRTLRDAPKVADLCGSDLKETHAYGAFDDFAACLR